MKNLILNLIIVSLCFASVALPITCFAGQGMGPGPGIYYVAAAAATLPDNFNRANGGLGYNWTTITGLSAPQIASNQVSNTSGEVGAVWNISSGATQWAQADFALSGDPEFVYIYLRTTPSSANSFYACEFYINEDSYVSELYKGASKLVNTNTALNSYNDLCDMGGGDIEHDSACEDDGGNPVGPPSKIYGSANGSTISCDYYFSYPLSGGGMWAGTGGVSPGTFISGTDSTFPSGYIGLGINGNATMDNFNGNP